MNAHSQPGSGSRPTFRRRRTAKGSLALCLCLCFCVLVSLLQATLVGAQQPPPDVSAEAPIPEPGVPAPPRPTAPAAASSEVPGWRPPDDAIARPVRRAKRKLVLRIGSGPVWVESFDETDYWLELTAGYAFPLGRGFSIAPIGALSLLHQSRFSERRGPYTASGRAYHLGIEGGVELGFRAGVFSTGLSLIGGIALGFTTVDVEMPPFPVQSQTSEGFAAKVGGSFTAFLWPLPYLGAGVFLRWAGLFGERPVGMFAFGPTAELRW